MIETLAANGLVSSHWFCWHNAEGEAPLFKLCFEKLEINGIKLQYIIEHSK